MPYRRSRLQDYYDQLFGRKPAKSKTKESTSTHSPFLDFRNPPAPAPVAPPKPPTPTPPPTPPSPSAPTQENPPTQRSTGQESKSDAGKRNDSGRDKSDNKSAPSKPHESQPSISGFPQDIEWSPEFEARGIMPIMQAAVDGMRDSSEDKTTAICEALYAANPEAVARGVTIMTGCEPDDEQDTMEALMRLAHSIGLAERFESEPWYSTKLGSSESIALSAATKASLSDQERVSVDAPDRDPRRLNYHSLAHARNYIDGWDEAWETEGDFSDFIIGKLADTYEIHALEGFADLPIEDQLQEFLEFIYFHRESYYSRTGQYESPYAWYILEKDYDDLLPLLGLIKPAPLHSPDALADAFGFVSQEHGVDYLRHHLDLVYADMGYDLPENWSSLQDPNQLAKMLYSALEEIKLERESNKDFDIEFGLDFKFHDAYGLHGSDVNRDLSRLAGTHQSPDYSLFVFIIGMLWEPVDLAITFAEIGEDIARGDGLSAFIRGLIGIVPGAWGRFFKRFRSADEITDSFHWFVAANVSKEIPAELFDFDRRVILSGNNLRDDILNRGYPEQVADKMISSNATRPASARVGAGKGFVSGEFETPKGNIGIERQNDVIRFLADEGFVINSLGPDRHPNRLKVYEAMGINTRKNPDALILQTLPDGTFEPRIFDIYSPVGKNPVTIENMIRKKATDPKGGGPGQAQHIIINLRDVSDKAIERVKERLMEEPDRHLKELIILRRVRESASGIQDFEFVDSLVFTSTE